MIYLKVLGLLVVVLMLFIRLSPADIGRWHVRPPSSALEFESGTNTIIGGGESLFQTIVDIASATARTKRLAGSIHEGMVTFETRSMVFGFPDYTTIALMGDGQIAIHARLRFGRSDLGVNKARVRGWLERAQAGP